MAITRDRTHEFVSDEGEQGPIGTIREDETDLLIDVVGHAAVLTELRGEALSREALERRLDVSTSTCYRYTNQLDELDVIAESGSDIHLTTLGETITEEVMTFKTGVERTLRPGDDSQDVYVELLRLAPGLQALSRRPLDRRELEARLGVSNSTGYRMTRSLEDLALIEKAKGRYEITPRGTAVLEAVSQFEANVQTALRLGPVLGALREADPSVDLDAFADATVTTIHGLTHSPQNRFLNLLGASDTMRGVDTASIAAGYLADVQQHIREGMDIEEILEPEIAADGLAEYTEEAIETCRSNNVSLFLHDDLWYSLAIFDERIGVGVLDTESGVCRSFVDTDSAAARRWACDVYDSYKTQAVHLPKFDPFTLRQVVEDMREGTPQPANRS